MLNGMKTPDITSVQVIAILQPFVTATLGLLVAFGIEMTNQQQTAVIAFTASLAAFVSGTLVIADAIIRSGRAKAAATVNLAVAQLPAQVVLSEPVEGPGAP
jgi:uncharacterized membrane protein YoaK (UPF0700 family)